MTGYWIVLTMLGIAVVAVLVAVATDDQDDRHVRRTPAVNRLARTVVVLGAAQDGAENDWVARLRACLPPSVTVRGPRTADGALTSLPRQQLVSALAASPDVVVLAPPVADIRAGVPLARYEQALAAILTTLANHDIRTIVGTLPRLDTFEPDPMTPERSAMVRLTGEHWNAGIARLASAYGATVVDLDPLPDSFPPDSSFPDRLADLLSRAVMTPLDQADLAPADR